MPKNPLCEVFGYPIANYSPTAKSFRNDKLCPYNNISANCTKDKIKNPLGVCSIFDGDDIAITCPVRFRQDWLIVSDAAEYFFDPGTSWTTLPEVRLNDANGKSAGNIDLILVSYDNGGKLVDFGAVEVQAVYISGNIRQPFEKYMKSKSADFAWDVSYNYPKPDYLSSSRKRLIPQLMFKGGILNTWGKKIGVVLHESFYSTLPALPEVHRDVSNIAWFIYGLDYDNTKEQCILTKRRTIYTKFGEVLKKISTPTPGELNEFVNILQEKLDEKLEEGSLPEAKNLSSMFSLLSNKEEDI
jgi:hypothetical protein